MALPDSSFFNRSPSTIQKEQVEELYNKLYPYIVDDFYHRKDVDEWIAKIKAEINNINSAISIMVAGVNSGFAILSASISASILAHIHLATVVGATGVSVGTTAGGIALSPPLVPNVVYGGKNVLSSITGRFGISLVTVGTSILDGAPEKKKKSSNKVLPPFTIEK